MRSLTRMTGFRYSLVGLALLAAALVLLVVADTPLASIVDAGKALTKTIRAYSQESIEVNSTYAGLKSRDYFIELSLLTSKPARLLVGAYGYSKEVEVSQERAELVYFPGVPREILVRCINCTTMLDLTYSYSIYRLARPYFQLLYPAIALMILGTVMGLLGLSYIVLEARVSKD